MIGGGPRIASGAVVTSEMVASDEVLLKSEYYNDFLRKIDLRYLLGSIVFREQHRVSHLSFLRPRRAGAFGREEIKLLRQLTPHLQRALQLHTRIVDLQRGREAVEKVLDRLTVGIVLLDASGKAVLVNRSASDIFAARDGLFLDREGLHACTGNETVGLRRLVQECLQASSGDGMGAGGPLAVSRPSLRRAYSVLVTPLKSSRSAFGRVQPSAAIFITDPSRKIEANRDALRSLYGFTQAEARMAEHLMQGMGVEEAGVCLGITVNTARTHVRHLFDKTGTNRHRELVRLLFLGCAGLSSL